ncbi:hypothetical protein O6H91_12G106900 [Diphasiastrum complanatum]|uniref:Uncharacterized protein n=1 Tax=Diphasiastrum complanatum TaxID=34168 RepID=A0ACC2C5P5_DIPCM|nr:hypothetical protein O6H91_12G106900 [Diphasiastrum complanatum]
MELKGTGTGAMAWPDCSFTEEVGLSCDVSSPLVYASSCNDSLAPLEVVKDDRAFLDPTAMTLSSSVSGLGLHDWMREDTIGNMADMDCSISSICGDLFPAKLEQELNLFPSVLDVSMCGKEILTWGSEEIDLDANDVVNAFQVKSESVQQNLLSRSLNPPGSAASSLISTQVVASPTVSIKKPAIGRLADLKKIIVKKPILDKAVERLGGGKDGALKLWKLIQIWLKHQKPQNRIPWAAMAESQEACLDISTSAQQKIVDELLRLPSDMDINFQDRLALMPGEFQNIPKTDFPPVFDAANVQLGIAGLNTAQNASAVPDHSNGQGFRSQTSLLPENGQQFAVTADSASTDLGCNYTNNVSVESLRLPAVPNIRATAPLTPPGLDVSVLHRTSAIQGHQINRNKTEERQGIVQPHVNGQLQEGMKQQAMMGSRSALDVPTSLPIIGAGVGESTMIGSSTAIAATTRAARKNRMARQRSSLAHHRRRLARTSCLRYPSIHTNGAYLNSFDLQNVDAPYALSSGKGRYWERNLKLFLEKELKSSDVGNLGRIVLPKKESESHLPNLTAREGVAILMEDINLSQSWDFRYRVQQELNSEISGVVGCRRFWPNNKSRMYLLENTGEFVKSHSLEEGDFVMLYKDCTSGKYVCSQKSLVGKKLLGQIQPI